MCDLCVLGFRGLRADETYTNLYCEHRTLLKV